MVCESGQVAAQSNEKGVWKTALFKIRAAVPAQQKRSAKRCSRNQYSFHSPLLKIPAFG
jgi:hypothetical protein